jgi:hypothetical protein
MHAATAKADAGILTGVTVHDRRQVGPLPDGSWIIEPRVHNRIVAPMGELSCGSMHWPVRCAIDGDRHQLHVPALLTAKRTKG